MVISVLKISLALDSEFFLEDELEALIDEDWSQTQEELAGTLEVTQKAVYVQLKSIVMINKQDNQVPNEMKPRDWKGDFFLPSSCFKGQQERAIYIA